MNGQSDSHCQCPCRCFCKYNVEELTDLGRKKILEKTPTIELMKLAQSSHEKDLVCVISMLDIDESIADIMIQDHMADASCDVLACRENLKNRLYARLKI